MRVFVLVLIGVLVIGGAFAVQHMRLQRAESSIALLEKDLAAARKDAAAWKLTADQARAGQTALAGQAQACLDREAAAQADADQWQAILDGNADPRDERRGKNRSAGRCDAPRFTC